MPTTDNANSRAILAELGIGDFNATLLIPNMMIAPAQTDPSMASVKLLTRAMQKTMQKMGAPVIASGTIDQNTAYCLHALAGPQWNDTVWFDLAKRLIAARDRGLRFNLHYGAVGGRPPVELSGISDLLPDIPNLPFIAIGAYLAYRYFKKR